MALGVVAFPEGLERVLYKVLNRMCMWAARAGTVLSGCGHRVNGRDVAFPRHPQGLGGERCLFRPDINYN